MSNTRYTPNPDFEAEMQSDVAVRAELVKRAMTALLAAQAASPSATYSRKLAVEEDAEGVRLISTWSLWIVIEYGTTHSPAYAPLRRGLEAAGLTLTDG